MIEGFTYLEIRESVYDKLKDMKKIMGYKRADEVIEKLIEPKQEELNKIMKKLNEPEFRKAVMIVSRTIDTMYNNGRKGK